MIYLDLACTGLAPVELLVHSNDSTDLPREFHLAISGYQQARAHRHPTGAYLSLLAESIGLGIFVSERICCGQIQVNACGRDVTLILRGQEVSEYKKFAATFRRAFGNRFDVTECPPRETSPMTPLLVEFAA